MWQATATNQQRNVLYQEHYDPYGARIIGQSTEQNTLWYTGKEHDADTGLTYLGSRWYDPRIGAAITARAREDHCNKDVRGSWFHSFPRGQM